MCALGAALALPFGAKLHAQEAAGAPPVALTPARFDRWSVGAQYLHVGAAAIGRKAEPSISVFVARHLGANDRLSGPRVEAGWLRASRPTTQAQGLSLGAAYDIAVIGRRTPDAPHFGVVVRPGIAGLAGWAEAQTWRPYYQWRATGPDGAAGTAYAGVPVRGRTTGVGASLAADVHLARAVALTGAVQRWTFRGAVIRPNRRATLAGVGLTLRPRALATDVRRWWHAGHAPVTRGERTEPTNAGGVAPLAGARPVAPTADVGAVRP